VVLLSMIERFTGTDLLVDGGVVASMRYAKPSDE
jgi:hypothetical protein